ncbi:MAG: hypothetical protein C0513_00325 [Isosphaera sp.]|nr:hypothetical protein [Isosphaera sp.]
MRSRAVTWPAAHEAGSVAAGACWARRVHCVQHCCILERRALGSRMGNGMTGATQRGWGWRALIAGVALVAVITVWLAGPGSVTARPAGQAGAGAVVGEGGGAEAALAVPLRVVTSIPPLAGLIRPLLPEGSQCQVLVPPGSSEHAFEPAPGRIAQLGQADLVLLVGLGLEPGLETAARRGGGAGRVIVMAEVLGIGISHGGGDVHDAGHQHDHVHEADAGRCAHSGDAHVWLDPVMARLYVERVAAHVARASREKAGPAGLSPAQAQDLEARRTAALEALGALEADYASALAPARGRRLVVAHDAWGWLCQRYGLRSVAVQGRDADEPTPGSLVAAIEAVRTDGLRAVFSERQLSARPVQRVAAVTGVEVLTLDPLGDGDYLAMMRANLAALVRGLGLAAPAGPR